MHLPLQNSILSVSFNFSCVIHYPQNAVTYKNLKQFRLLLPEWFFWSHWTRSHLGVQLKISYRSASGGWLDNCRGDGGPSHVSHYPAGTLGLFTWWLQESKWRVRSLLRPRLSQKQPTIFAPCCYPKQVTSCWRRSSEDLTASGPISRT